MLVFKHQKNFIESIKTIIFPDEQLQVFELSRKEEVYSECLPT